MEQYEKLFYDKVIKARSKLNKNKVFAFTARASRVSENGFLKIMKT